MRIGGFTIAGNRAMAFECWFYVLQAIKDVFLQLTYLKIICRKSYLHIYYKNITELIVFY
jgi:hypothetical protein